MRKPTQAIALVAALGIVPATAEDADTVRLRAVLERCSAEADQALLDAAGIASDQVLQVDSDRDTKARARDSQMAYRLIARLRDRLTTSCRR